MALWFLLQGNFQTCHIYENLKWKDQPHDTIHYDTIFLAVLLPTPLVKLTVFLVLKKYIYIFLNTPVINDSQNAQSYLPRPI